MKRVFIITITIVGSMLSDSVFADHIRHGSHEGVYYHRPELPRRVVSRLADRYHHFDLIYTRSVHRRGRLTFDLLIQHGSTFIEVTIGERGRIHSEITHRRFPLTHHYCGAQCSFQYLHYEDGRFLSYDPYYGCDVHTGLIVKRYPYYKHSPYYGAFYGRGFRHHDHSHRNGKHRHHRYRYGREHYIDNHNYKHDSNRKRPRNRYEKQPWDDRAYERYYRPQRRRG